MIGLSVEQSIRDALSRAEGVLRDLVPDGPEKGRALLLLDEAGVHALSGYRSVQRDYPGFDSSVGRSGTVTVTDYVSTSDPMWQKAHGEIRRQVEQTIPPAYREAVEISVVVDPDHGWTRFVWRYDPLNLEGEGDA